jgi:SAM-dependent methyltransferase
MTQKTVKLQEQINQYWNESALTGQAKSADGRPIKAIRAVEREVWLTSLQPLLPPPPTDVIDVGTGTGFLAFLLADLGHRVTGIDLAESMLEGGRALARERTEAGVPGQPPVFMVGDAMVPPLPPSSADVVANRNVTWTLLDPELALRNWFTLLRRGGRLLAIHHWVMDSAGRKYADAAREALPSLRDPTTHEAVNRFDPRYTHALAQMARDVGFVEVTITDLVAVDRYDEEQGSEHLGWLALTAGRPG